MLTKDIRIEFHLDLKCVRHQDALLVIDLLRLFAMRPTARRYVNQINLLHPSASGQRLQMQITVRRFLAKLHRELVSINQPNLRTRDVIAFSEWIIVVI